jgi:ubiquinone/menaquinone biosynthesis C-methylase UbiE
MLLNRVEKALMNNPIRAAIQRQLEARWLLALGGPVSGGNVLEIGCGRGVGTELILDRFGAAHVDAFDLDPDMVSLAYRRVARRGNRVRLWVGSVEAIDATDASYDAVFDFGILHHVPDWRRGLAEVHRVLKPGGRFYAEEVMRAFLLNPFVRRTVEHPLEDRFDAETFVAALEAQGFAPLGPERQRKLGPWFAWFVADKPSGARGATTSP